MTFIYLLHFSQVGRDHSLSELLDADMGIWDYQLGSLGKFERRLPEL